MDAAFEPWVRTHLADGTYVGLFLEEDGKVLTSAGIYFMEFPPHWMDPEPLRAYLLNFYTIPEARGRGYAKQILAAAVAECRTRGPRVITLHASRFGRPIYERFGFTPEHRDDARSTHFVMKILYQALNRARLCVAPPQRFPTAPIPTAPGSQAQG